MRLGRTITTSNPSTDRTSTWVWLHTVSGFCKNESWTGYLQAARPLELSTASICLVNRVEMAGRNWKNWPGVGWILNYDLPVGVPSGSFYLSTWQQEGGRPLCFNYGGVHRRTFCG